MRLLSRRVINLVAFAIFFGALAYSIWKSPPELEHLEVQWLLLTVIVAILSLATQAGQTLVFTQHESLRVSIRWAMWLTCEKAWVNTIFPAKAGTAGAVVLFKTRFRVNWDRYLRFILRCGVLALSASAASLAFLSIGGIEGAFAAALLFVALALASAAIYSTSLRPTLVLGCLSAFNLIGLAAGVGTCMNGLGYSPSLQSILSIGVALNALAVASLTPGNFGVREILLAVLAPALSIELPILIQASTAFVFVRLGVSFLFATVLRPHALPPSSSAHGD